MKINIELSDELIDLLQNIIDQGYDPFDLNDKFYREICTPYNSENGTDVLLDDREEYIYSTIENETSCPSGCVMSSYSLDSKYITCECDANDTGIVELDYHHISGKNVAASLLSSLKNSNYKVMRCYNLVFNFKIFCHNYGSIITLIFFVIYVIFMITYICKGIIPLKVHISQLLFDEKQKNVNDNTDAKAFIFKAKSEISRKNKSNKKTKQNKSSKDFYPPKKFKIKRTKNADNNSFEKKKPNKELKLLDLLKKKRRSIKNAPQKDDQESVKSDKVRKRKSIIDYQAEIIMKTRDNLLRDQLNGNIKKNEDQMKKKENEQKLKSTVEKYDREKDNDKLDSYDNFELNHMDYSEACEFDNRSCLRTYWSILLREHYVLFTFISRIDYNLFFIKIERFFILICTEMTMNGMFFVHETMYKKKTGGMTVGQKIPQYIFSLIVSHVLEVILCFLSMTDIHYYEIKAMIRSDNNDKDKKSKYSKINKEKEDKKGKSETDDKIFDILNCVQRKLIAFFIFTFLVFLFHWYFISAFCAVYQNTQLIYLRDSGISILTSLIDPFIIYGITCIIRVISLSLCCKKKLYCLYKLSELIPIF